MSAPSSSGTETGQYTVRAGALSIELQLEEKSRRFYDSGGDPNKKYSWEALENGHG